MKKTIMLSLFLAFAFNQQLTAQWTQVYHNEAAAFTQIVFPTDSIGYAVADKSIYKTIDAGGTWTEIPFGRTISKIYMRSATFGYAISGHIISLFGTANGFKTVTNHKLDTCYVVQGLSFINDSTGYYLNNEGRFRKILKNGFEYLYLGDTIDASNLCFANANVGYLSGGREVIKTNDGGISWKKMGSTSPLTLGLAVFSSPDTGYFLTYDDSLIKAKIVKTTDGAKSFKIIKNFPGQDIAVQKDFCIVVGDTGQVIWSLNGGVSWVNEATGMFTDGTDLHNVAISPNGTCYVSSSTGSIYRKTKFGTSGVQEKMYTQHMISLYPNPAQKFITVDLKNIYLQESPEIIVFDCDGRRIFSNRLTSSIMQIDISRLSSGQYYCELIQQGLSIASETFIVK